MNNKGQQPSHQILDRVALYNGFFKLYRYRIQYQRFDGQWEKPLTRELIKRPRVAAVLPYDPVNDQVVLINQFRMGTILGEQPPWQWEIVAGLIDTDETTEQLAYREAEEEAGLKVRSMEFITRYWLSPGACTERADLFCGFVDASKAGGIWGVDEEHEDIKVQAFPAQEAIQGVEDGWIDNATSMIALQWLALNHDRLKQT
jgi:ADP-ribose pyrophosphatase